MNVPGWPIKLNLNPSIKDAWIVLIADQALIKYGLVRIIPDK